MNLVLLQGKSCTNSNFRNRCTFSARLLLDERKSTAPTHEWRRLVNPMRLQTSPRLHTILLLYSNVCTLVRGKFCLLKTLIFVHFWEEPLPLPKLTVYSPYLQLSNIYHCDSKSPYSKEKNVTWIIGFVAGKAPVPAKRLVIWCAVSKLYRLWIETLIGLN